MKKNLRLAPLAWLLISEVHGACETRVEPIAFTEAKETAGPVIREPELRSVVMNPPAGAELRPDTEFSIDLEYRIVDFAGGDYRLTPLFKTGLNRSRSFDTDGKDPSVALATAAGRVHLCVPLAAIYRDHALEVAWPLELALVILKGDPRGSSRSVAMHGPLKLNSLEVPAAALERQAKAPPPEYEAALDSAFNNYAVRGAVYKVCLQRLPALQARLTPAYRSWESRNRADIDWVYGLKFEALKEQAQGRVDAAMEYIDELSDAMQNSYESWTEEQLTPQCADIIEQEKDGGVDKSLERNLAVLRKWRAQP
jgi:hypothetical protein